MNTKGILITTCALIFTLLTNCTIEKRVFQKGYYIEWKKRASNETTQNEPDKSTIASDKPSEKRIQEEITGNPVSEKGFVISNEQKSEATPVSVITNTTDESTVSSRKINSSDPVTITNDSPTDQAKTTPPDQKDDDPRLETEPKVFEPVGFVSFGFYFLAVMLGLFAIPALNALPFLVFSGVLLILSLTFGIISVIRYRRNRERYHRNFFGYFGLIASMITITLGGLVILFAFLADSF